MDSIMLTDVLVKWDLFLSEASKHSCLMPKRRGITQLRNIEMATAFPQGEFGALPVTAELMLPWKCYTCLLNSCHKKAKNDTRLNVFIYSFQLYSVDRRWVINILEFYCCQITCPLSLDVAGHPAGFSSWMRSFSRALLTDGDLQETLGRGIDGTLRRSSQWHDLDNSRS